MSIKRLKTTTLGEVITRLERLETLEKLRGDMMLFNVQVETASGDYVYLVAADNFETVRAMIPDQHTINYLGRASNQYEVATIIAIYQVTFR